LVTLLASRAGTVNALTMNSETETVFTQEEGGDIPEYSGLLIQTESMMYDEPQTELSDFLLQTAFSDLVMRTKLVPQWQRNELAQWNLYVCKN
jgi:hypothetical protein